MDEMVVMAGGISKPDTGMKELSEWGDFTFKEFASKEEIDAYVGQASYGSDEVPALCFAFQILEDDSKKKYELEVFFNDKWPNKYRFGADSTFE